MAGRPLSDIGRMASFMLCAALPLAALEGGALYDRLYTRGYHGDLNYTHSSTIVKYIITQPNIRSVLDYGCSHGWAVEALWEHGINATGYDVSRVAAAIADKKRTRGRACVAALNSCFTSDGALLDSVDARMAVDAVMSSDVLEHVPIAEVDSVARRMAHLARSTLVLKIATSVEANRQPLKTLWFWNRPRALHVTVRPMRWWLGVFARVGFTLAPGDTIGHAVVLWRTTDR